MGERRFKKIAFVIPTLTTGGAERTMSYLVSGLSENYKTYLFCLRERGEYWEKLSQERRVDLYHIGRTHRFDVSIIWKLAKQLKQISPDIVQTMLPYANFYGMISSYLANVPLCVTGIMSSNMEHVRLGPKVYTKLDQIVSNQLADRVVCNSDAGREVYIKQGGQSRKAEVIENGIDIGSIRQRAREDHYIDVPENELSIGCFARITPTKNQATLVKAIKLFARGGKTAHLYLAGSAEDKRPNQLQGQIKKSGMDQYIHYLGNLENPFPVMASMDVLTLSSLGEGMSNVIMEGMALEKPIVATDVGDTDKLVEHKKTGMLCPVNDPRAFSRAFSYYANHREKIRTHGKNGFQKIKHFTKQKMVDRYETLYQRIHKTLKRSPDEI